ncbi:hypothetical protein MTO96_035896 [Rhipicephalus appendiculatus]
MTSSRACLDYELGFWAAQMSRRCKCHRPQLSRRQVKHLARRHDRVWATRTSSGQLLCRCAHRSVGVLAEPCVCEVHRTDRSRSCRRPTSFLIDSGH